MLVYSTSLPCPCPAPHAHLLMATQPSSQPFTSLSEPIMMSLRPGSEPLEPQPLPPEKKPFSNSMVQVSPGLLEPMAQLATNDDRTPRSLLGEKTPKWATERRLEEKSWLSNGTDIFECPPPKTENEVGGERGLQGGGAWWAGREMRAEGQPAGPDLLAWTLTLLVKCSHLMGSD